MKYLIFLTTISLIFLSSCEKKEDCNCKCDVKNLLPIDWENYNDVYTVYCTFSMNDYLKAGCTGKTIKITGWLLQPGANLHEIDLEHFYLTNAPNRILLSDGPNVQIRAPKEVKIKFENSDLTKKCYITGELCILALTTYTIPEITVTNVDNIIFE